MLRTDSSTLCNSMKSSSAGSTNLKSSKGTFIADTAAGGAFWRKGYKQIFLEHTSNEKLSCHFLNRPLAVVFAYRIAKSIQYPISRTTLTDFWSFFTEITWEPLFLLYLSLADYSKDALTEVWQLFFKYPFISMYYKIQKSSWHYLLKFQARLTRPVSSAASLLQLLERSCRMCPCSGFWWKASCHPLWWLRVAGLSSPAWSRTTQSDSRL